jgi:cyclic dehypoxanthinyl futalosine synthase
MVIVELIKRAINGGMLGKQEGEWLYYNATLPELMFTAHEIRKKLIIGNKVTWQIDRNVNITNVCVAGCKFCNFHCGIKDKSAYITTLPDYKLKIDEMLKIGGEQLLLQGGLHPKLGLEFYTSLFREIKEEYPRLKLHALGPPEIAHLAKIEGLTYKEVILELIHAGLDSIPGGGAEILVDRVRKQISPGKPSAQEWLNVMSEAHQLGLLTTATMMFGHIETVEERFEHLLKIRELQSQKPSGTIGFNAFICWPFVGKGTKLEQMGVKTNVTSEEYIRMVAISRIMLPNIKHIQASWLTVGVETAQLCLHAGADDFGSIMIEENVVSSAGAQNSLNAYSIQKAISDEGFEPQLRDQAYNHIDLPDVDFSKIIK